MSIDFIPIQAYTSLYYHTLLVVVLITFFFTQSLTIDSRLNLDYVKISGILLLLFTLLYIGLRPINGVFIDMTNYAYIFEHYQEGYPITSERDVGFHFFMYLSSNIMSVQKFFLMCAGFYVLPLYFVCKKWFPKYWFYAFLMLVGSFSFWSYGTNGIRNGIAASLFLLAISREKRIFQAFWLSIAINFHLSMSIPILGFIITQFYRKPKVFLIIWFLSIPLSLAVPGFWENLFSGLVGDQRSVYLTEEANSEVFSSVGFRWDFLLYSASGIFAGWYYLFKKKFQDPIYGKLFNTYIIANAFWILVIRANFSNRFAYLSWFMLALVIIYPLLKRQFLKYQFRVLGLILLSYFIFTYFMNVILTK